MNWLKERLGYDTINYEIPGHANWIGYALGGVTLIGILVLILTGFYISQFYSATPEAARSSLIAFTEGNFNAAVRNIHFWTAQLVFITAFLHLSRIIVTGSYTKPREINYLIGLSLFGVLVSFIATGTILRYDQEAFEALEHLGEISDYVPMATIFTEGFWELSSVLERVYSFHTSIIPVIFLALFGVHAVLVKVLKISPLPSGKDTGTTTFFQHYMKVTGLAILLILIAAVMSIVLPQKIGPAPVQGIEVTKPLWMFLPIYFAEDFIGVVALLVLPAIIGIILVAFPLINRDGSRRHMVYYIFLSLVVIVTLIILYVLFTPPVAHMK